MCCQIFRNNPNYNPSDKHSSETIGTGDRNREAAAIVYGANNGAIISQNSWGYDRIMKQTPQVIKDAIHYFNTYAGGNKTDKPLMQGGLVVFAAGNDATSAPSMPSAELSVVSVSSFNPDFSASWYTNYEMCIRDRPHSTQAAPILSQSYIVACKLVASSPQPPSWKTSPAIQRVLMPTK